MIKGMISVLICAYNAEKTIQWTLNSVIAQTYKNLEILVLDNDSKDKTLDLLLQYQQKYPQIKIFSAGENLWPYRGLNYLMKRAQGEYFAIQDHDDVWHSTKLAKQITYLDHHPELIGCGTDRLEYFAQSEKGYEDSFPNPFKMVWHTSLVMRKTEKTYEESFLYLCDQWFMQKILCQDQLLLGNLSEVLTLHYNKEDGSNFASKWFHRTKENLMRGYQIFGIWKEIKVLFQQLFPKIILQMKRPKSREDLEKSPFLKEMIDRVLPRA